MDDWRLRWGKVTPAVWTNGTEFHAMLPDGVEMLVVTLGVNRTTDADLGAARDARAEAARRLADWGAECVVAGGGPVATLEGLDAELAFVEETRAALDVPFTTSVEAQVDALRALGAESLLAVTPFTADRDAQTAAYFEGRGFDVVDVGGVEIEEVAAIRELSGEETYDLAKRAALDAEDDFDVLYLPCAAWRGVGYVAALEEDTGHPVVTSTQAQLWAALGMGRVSPPIEGFGSLFETL